MAKTLVCVSHLRWDYVYQRPNHLMARAARAYDVLFVEEPVYASRAAGLELRRVDGLTVVRPHLAAGDATAGGGELSTLLDQLLRARGAREPVLWYYTPAGLPWTEHIAASVTVYDCMDELSAFRQAPPELLELEARLLARADLVFTGGRQLYEAKRARARNVHSFPSSVDREHFAQARDAQPDPKDQTTIGRPRIGYFGVIDERIDLELLGEVADRRPDWQFVLVGPVAKIDPDDIPALPNVHQLGLKSYAELPAYLASWDVAWMPFAHNRATRYISPTKTPEYLAGGKPVVSTSIRDVVDPYGKLGLVRIADTGSDMIAAIAAALEDDGDWIERADALLARQSWDRTWSAMDALVTGVRAARGKPGLARDRRRGIDRTTSAGRLTERSYPVSASRGANAIPVAGSDR